MIIFIFLSRHVRNLRDAGSPVNKHIVKATAHGVVKYYKPSYYSTIAPSLGDTWARSLMIRMGMTKRKGNLRSRNIYCKIALTLCLSEMLTHKINYHYLQEPRLLRNYLMIFPFEERHT